MAIALTSVAITRLLGAAGIGAYSISAALLFVFGVLFELGLPQALAYYAGREEWSGRPLARGAIGLCFALSLPGAAAMIGGYALFGGSLPEITWPMAIALAAALPFFLLWRVGPQAALAGSASRPSPCSTPRRRCSPARSRSAPGRWPGSRAR